MVAEGRALTLAATVALDTHEQEAFIVALLRGRQMHITSVEDGIASLWPRALLPGWYDEWVVVERERLNQLRLHALERAAALLTAHGDFDRGLDLAVEAVRTEPLRESANEQLVRVHLARGNVYDALRQFDVYRRLVAAELDAEPCAALRALVAPWIRRGSDAATGARPAWWALTTP